MTKKHFIAIAAIIAQTREYEQWDADTALEHVARALARYFAEQNLNFDGQRFLKACGHEHN